MKVIGVEGMTYQEVQAEIERGGRFVLYQYCISVIVMTFRRSSDIHFVKADRSRAAAGLPFTLMSFFLGWWGIPWGPIFTIGCLYTNLRGGKDVTAEMQQQMLQNAYHATLAAETPPPLP